MKIIKIIGCTGQNDLHFDLENMTLTFTFFSHIRFWLSVSDNLFFNTKIFKFCSLIVKINFIACIGQSDLDLEIFEIWDSWDFWVFLRFFEILDVLRFFEIFEIQITPTLHVLLAHGCALVEENGGYGLKIFSEEPLESNNKYIRKFRENLARKTNQIENLTDVCARLWVKSDPIICSIKRKQYCTICKIHTDHTSLSSTCPEKIKFSPQQEDDAFLDQFLDKNSAE